MFNVLVADGMEKEGVEIFQKHKDINVDVKKGLSSEEILQIIDKYDGLVVRSATKFKGELLEKAKNIKVVGRAGAGVDNIDVEAASKKGIIVMNTPGGNSAAVAELAIAMMLTLSRHIVKASMSMKEGRWEKSPLAKTSVEVAGKTLGLLGAGNIGSLVANKAIGLKMNVLVYDPFLTEEKASILGVKKVDGIDKIFADSDYISLHLPKNEETIGLINKNSFGKMKDGVFIVNCARGGIIDEKDLLDALNSGKVQGAGLDVFVKEPVDPSDPLVMHPNVVCTPHLGASSIEAQINVSIAIAEQLCDFFIKGEIRNAINAPSLDAATRELISPYTELAQKMGTLYKQIANTNISEISVDYEGEVNNLPISSITNSLLIGLLSGNVEGINFINAANIAKDMGIKIQETKKQESLDYASQITLNVKHKEGESVIKGAVFKKGVIRIVEIDGFVLDFVPKGNLLLTLNNDVPGFIGEIGTLIGSAGLNISNMELGRKKNIGKALSFIQVDGEITDDILDKVSNIKALEKVYRIKMG